MTVGPDARALADQLEQIARCDELFVNDSKALLEAAALLRASSVPDAALRSALAEQEPAEPTCGLCGGPMPPGEEMFKYHGYSGPCPKRGATNLPDDVLLRFWQSVQGPRAGLTGPLIRFAGLVYREASSSALSRQEPAEAPTNEETDDFTPEQIAELRRDFDEWLSRRNQPIPEAVLRMIAPWQFAEAPKKADTRETQP